MQGVRLPTRSGETALTLILLGLVFGVIGELVLLGVGVLFFVTILGGISLVAAVIGIIWLVLVYVYSYRPTREGEYAAARTPTLVFAILSLVTLALVASVLSLIAYVRLLSLVTFAFVASVLYLIAYVKLVDAEGEVENSPTPLANSPDRVPVYYPARPVGAPPPSVGPRFCSRCGQAIRAGAAFCQSCGSRLD